MKNYKKISLIFVLYLAIFFSAIRMDDYLFDGNLNQELSTLKRQLEPLMTKVTRFLGIEHTCKRISLLTAVSLIYQAIPVVPTVFDDWI
ncbi:hypothetical protein [Enterococcus sp. AZ152]|uniref:hypothetical protein n=1 Tax=Enterococcus sp. AZ152 TaxID=2774848 RepID=UPI003F254E38